MELNKVKKGVAITATGFILYAIGMMSLSDDMVEMLIQIFGLSLVFGASMIIALESAKAKYLETLKAKHVYETNRVRNAIKDTFYIAFSEESKALKSRKQEILSSIENLKKERIEL